MAIRLGIDRILKEKVWSRKLGTRRVALLAHPASATAKLEHSLDALRKQTDFNITAAFGPQHGMRGEKQDNMIESQDYRDPVHGIPVFSLYGKVRRPTREMLDSFDVMLVDLQDVGCRIYTFLTTLFYVLEDCAKAGKAVWVLDRPNPAGRAVEGNRLDLNFLSFVGGAPIPMRHGLTLGEAALWYKDLMGLELELEVIQMQGYKPDARPGCGWPEELVWINPSPNMPRLTTARQYAGTVLLEGTKLSEGRGTTRPLENFGAPDIDSGKILAAMKKNFSSWLDGCVVRPTFYEPTFHKFKGQLVNALQIHVDNSVYWPKKFRPYRLIAAYLKSVRRLYPDYDLWLKPPYEYETVKMPIDILSGNSYLREWVDAPSSKSGDLERYLAQEEKSWIIERRRYLLY